MKCAYCGHQRKDHCTKGTRHTPYKEEMKQAGPQMKRHPYACVGDHCQQPMCDCLNFEEAR